MAAKLVYAGAMQMQEFIELLDSVVKQTTFDIRNSGTFTSTQYREIYEHDKLDGSQSETLAMPKIPEGPLIKLTGQLRHLLREYCNPESDLIGYGLANLIASRPHLRVADFTQILVRAAATLGTEQVAQLLFGWISGRPIHYQKKAFLSGVSVEQALDLEEGIRITPLPESLGELSAHLPVDKFHQHGFHSLFLLGGVMLSIDCEAAPAFYKPSTSEDWSIPIQSSLARGKLPGFSVGTFCEALSLACNGCVRWKFSWGDFGELEELYPGVLQITSKDIPNWDVTINLKQKNLKQARDIQLSRYSNTEQRPRLDTAINRWMRSKRFNASLSDRLIDLRIALEALFLKSGGGELQFRLATNGAWHLGNNFSERRDYYDMLRGTYKLASKAVHASEVDFSEQERNLLADAQDACRKGILKRLNEREEPDWEELILGGAQQEDTR